MKIAILGANFLQNKLVLKAKEMGIETHVFGLLEGAVAKENSDFFYPISITEKDKILEICKRLKIDGICSIASDIAVPTVNYISKNLNLIGNSEECSQLTTNKYEMRKALCKKGLPCPSYRILNDISDIKNEKLKYPLILKPVDRSGSRGIFKINNFKELLENIDISKEQSFCKKILLEEFIYGEEYSIESISQNGKHQIIQITKKYTTGSPNFIETGHLQPAVLSRDLEDRVKKIIMKALDALKIVNGASHSEIKIDGDKITIIEIASRMGGDFIGSDLVKLSTGIDFLQELIKVSLGQKIKDLEVNKKSYSVIKFILTMDDLKKVKKIEEKYKNNIVEKSIEKIFRLTKDSTSRNGYLILEFENNADIKHIREEIFN